MPSIRITRFAGLLPEVGGKLLREDHAQVAHNTLLWSGYLKAMPQWNNLGPASGTILSLYPDPSSDPQVNLDTQLSQVQVGWQEPYNPGLLYGINAFSALLKTKTGAGGTVYDVLPIPVVSGVTQAITNQNQSVYPISRCYAVTIMSGTMESAPVAFPRIGTLGNLFEGDIVTLAWTFTNALGVNATGCRLYRTIPGFDTSEQIGNPKDTVFHLVKEFPSFTGTFNFVDTFSADQILGDKMMTEQFGPPNFQFGINASNFLGGTEGGWLVMATYDGINAFSRIQVSERYLWHAWPLQNYVQIPDQITDGAVFYDELFFGTAMRPYHMRVTFSDNVNTDALDITVRPFPDTYGCIPNSMVATNFGAMYAAQDGLVALQVNDNEMATKKLTNPGDIFPNPVLNIGIADVKTAGWWNGFYLGFCDGVAYLYNNENNHNNQFPLGQLITLGTPAGFPGPSLAVGRQAINAFPGGGRPAFYAAWGNVLYDFPLPGYGYEDATKQTYTWRSKVFVMPGGTCFAAAKVVNQDDGAIQFNFYGDGNLIYSHTVTNSAPFRIPSQHSVIDVEIEMVGVGTVQEVHLSTSMRELTEPTGTDYG